MRLCWFNDKRLGLLEDGKVYDITAALSEIPSASYPWPREDALIARLPELRPAFLHAKKAATAHDPQAVRFLAPVMNPGKIFAAPVNYRKHLEEARADPAIHYQNQIGEIQKVGLFLKATSSLVGPSEGIAIAFPDRRNDHEIELVAVIGKTVRNVTEDRALEAIAGYAIGLDMTVRGTEERSMRKSIDSFSVVGPWLTTADELGSPNDLQLVLKVNGEVRQNANTRDLAINVAQLIVWASSYYTLVPGDILFTGTPEGVGPVQPGDVIHASIDRLGEMSVSVR